MNDEERKHAYAGIEEILDILKHNHRNKTSFGNEKGPYGRTLAEGEAAFHALIAISQLPEVKNADDNTIEIPRWVFDALVNIPRLIEKAKISCKILSKGFLLSA